MKAVGSALKTFNTGLNVGVGRGFANFAKTGSVGSNLAKIGGTMAIGGAIGATAGAGLGAASEGGLTPQTGAAIGGAIGATAIPMAGLAVGAVGSASVGLTKAGISAAPSVGRGLLGASPFVAATGLSLAADAGKSVWSVGKRMIDWNADADKFFEKIKLTGPISGMQAGWRNGNNLREKIGGSVSGSIINGKSMLATASAVQGARKAWGTLEREHMGQMTGVTRMTPQVASYSNDAGATGDLVFALNANRRG